MKQNQKTFSYTYSLPYNDFGQLSASAVEPAISTKGLVQFAKNLGLNTKLKANGNTLLDEAWETSGCYICVKAVKHAKCAIACYDCVISTKGCEGVEMN